MPVEMLLPASRSSIAIFISEEPFWINLLTRLLELVLAQYVPNFFVSIYFVIDHGL